MDGAAWDGASITHRRLGNGLSRATVSLPDAVMDRWLTHLHAFTSPRRDRDAGPYPHRLAHAFTALLERIPDGWLPQHGGTNTAVIVTIDHHQLRQDLATAGLTTGTAITASEARRLACGAGILPAVLDGRSQPLELGRTRRLFSSAQRKALAVRDRHCRVEGCDVPAQPGEVQGPPHEAVEHRRPDRPRRRGAALLLPPPPRPRHPL